MTVTTGTITLENNVALSSKAEYIHTLQSSKFYILERNSCMYAQGVMHSNSHDSNVYKSKHWHQPRCALTGELMRKYYIAMTYEWSAVTHSHMDESHEDSEQESKS